MSLGIDIRQAIREDFLFYPKIKKETILETIQLNEDKKLFIQIDTKIFCVDLVPGTNHMNYYPCAVSAETIEKGHAIQTLKSKQYILFKENDHYIGYVQSSDLLALFKYEYDKLNAFYQTVLDTIDGSCTVIDHNRKVITWTKGAEKLFSVKKEEIIGKPITDFFKPEQLALLNTLENRVSLHHKQHQAREDVVVLINSNPAFLHNEIIGAVVFEVDITSQIRLNNELNNTTERLLQLEREANLIIPEDPFKIVRGSSEALKKTIEMAKKVATTSTNILIHGESGVGKELFAKAIHTIRERKEAPFIAINCGAIPSTLFESEMFGYEKGAFSGADNRGKKGKVELAQDGTLFLDEIGEMPLEMQVKLLRLLQEKKFYPVGGIKEKKVGFRVIAATNRDLKKLVEEGKFREDLYYRLNVVSLEIPPLRERPEDIIELSHFFLYEISIGYNRPIHRISQEVMQALLNHQWQGNIRELRNVMERLVVFSEDGEIKIEHLPFEVNDFELSKETVGPIKNDTRQLSDRLLDVERNIILQELEKENGNKLAVAKKLKITRATLYNRLNKLGIKI